LAAISLFGFRYPSAVQYTNSPGESFVETILLHQQSELGISVIDLEMLVVFSL
jgi:hypothetical protein